MNPLILESGINHIGGLIMRIQVQSIHFDADQKLVGYIQEKCNKLDRFYDKIIDGQVFLKLENNHGTDNKTVEVKVNVPGETLIATHTGQRFEEAVDFCTDNLIRQVKRYKEKLRAHH